MTRDPIAIVEAIDNRNADRLADLLGWKVVTSITDKVIGGIEQDDSMCFQSTDVYRTLAARARHLADMQHYTKALAEVNRLSEILAQTTKDTVIFSLDRVQERIAALNTAAAGLAELISLHQAASVGHA